MPGDVRAPFERSLGTDLGSVRIHTGEDAASATAAVGARAFAVGQDVAFGAGQYAPETKQGRWLIAHEVAHTVQQRGTHAVAQHKLETTNVGDAAESEADRAADAIVAGQPASVTAQPRSIARFPPMGPMGGGGADETPAWKKTAGSAKDYVVKYGAAIINGLTAQIGDVPFETGQDGVTWSSGSASKFDGMFALEFFMNRDDPWQFLVTTLAPEDVERLIDKGRDALAMPDMAKWYNPGVQIELGNVYKTKLRESLLRVLPRYVSVWNQHVIAEEAKADKKAKNAPLPVAPEPTASEVRSSAPIDPYVIRALRGQLAVDFARYRELHPDERNAHAIKQIDKVTLEIQWQQKAINWARATPPEATAEDVANELYGSETYAYLITAAAPLFGFSTNKDDIGKLKQTYRDQLDKIQSNTAYQGSFVPAHGPSNDPAAQILGGPLGDEAAKNQAKGIKPTPNLTKAGIVERLRTIVGEIDWLQKSVAQWGQQSLLDAVKAKVDQRSRDIQKDPDNAAGAAWDGQSQVQLEVVQTCRNAVQMAAKQQEVFKSFASAGWLIINLVRDYVEAASVSDLGVTARAKVAAAEQKSRMFPADLMEALLDTFRPIIQSAKINKTKLEGKAGSVDNARLGSGEMEKKELELRQGLAKVRDLLMEHPEKAKPELDRLLAEVTTLSTEVTMVSNMDSCDAAWAALDNSLSKVGGAVSLFSSNHGNAPIKRDMAAVATMRLKWKTIYDKWKAAKTPEDKKAAENDLHTQAKSKEWTELFDKIKADIEDHATYDKWVTFGVMVGIAIITGGIGMYVEAAAGAAWGAAAGFAASTVVEAATFTTLSQTLIQKDPTLATYFDDFEKNLLMFGGLKAIGKVVGVAGKALELEKGEIAAGSVLAQFAALNGYSLYEADKDKRKRTNGQGLSLDEITNISFQNLAFLVAVSIGQRLAKPFLENIQLKGQIQGELFAARSANVKVENLAKQVEAEKGKDAGKARALTKALADALAKREAVLLRLGEQVKLYEAGDKKSVLTKEEYNSIKSEMADHAGQMADFARMQVLDLLVPAGPNSFQVVDGKALAKVVDYYTNVAKDGSTAVLVGTDPVTGAKTYEITTKDAAPWRVTERVNAKPGEVTKPPEATNAPDTKANAKDGHLANTPVARVRDALASNGQPSMADITELRRELADGKLKPEDLPVPVREKVFQGWKDVPESLRDIAEKTNLARIRTGKPGVIRSEADLSNQDVADSMNAQLQKVKPGEVDAMLNKFPPDQQANARRVLARASGFGDMEAMNSLNEAVQPHLKGGKLYAPGSGSLADNLTYLSSKQSFKSSPAKIPTTSVIEPGTIVIVDEVVLAKLKDPAFAASLNQPGVVLLRPRGFTSGINMFNGTPEMIARRTGELLTRANKIVADSGNKVPFDDAITKALDEATDAALKNAKVTGTLEAVDPAANPDLSSAGIAKQLNGNAGITAETIKQVLDQIPEEARAMVREMMAQQSEIFSTRRMAEDLARQNAQIVATAGVPASKIYFLIPEGSKSYGMVSMAHREATGTPVDRYINGPADAAKLGPDTAVVILDDVAGSGDSLVYAAGDLTSAGYKGKVIVSPIVSTGAAAGRFNAPGSKIAYEPGRVMQAITDTPMYKGLTPTQQQQLLKALGNLGWGQNGLSMAFPYMAPDNNSLLFGDKVAQEFIINKNADGAKKLNGPWKPPK